MTEKFKRTNIKVEIRDGMRLFTRTVFVNEKGHQFFKYGGQMCRIFKLENGCLHATFFNSVMYI